jgi:hypothetical protein
MCWWWPFAAVMLDGIATNGDTGSPVVDVGRADSWPWATFFAVQRTRNGGSFCNLPSDTTLQRSMVAGPEIQLLPLQVNIDDIPASSSGEALMFRGWAVGLAWDGLR